MTFSSRLTRCPIPFDADRAADAAETFGDLPGDLRDLLKGTAGCSPYLGGLIQREGDWLRPALSAPPETAMQALLDHVASLSASDMKAGMRVAKQRAALLIALADLGGVWPLETVTKALTDFADTCVDTGIRRLVAAEIARGKLPAGDHPDDAGAGGMVALAMGKQGAYELNFSSDIDLICLFDQDRYAPDDYYDVRAALVRVTRRLAALLSESTAQGYVFRTDLRLRPDAAVTPVCIAMEAAERYYESVGRTWERAAHIKARAAAGDVAAGAGYLDRLAPFVWRKHLDFASIQDAHDMRLKIRDHKGLHGDIQLAGHNMKLGRGGIREIEFFTQTRQLIAGGRDTDLRVRGTTDGLARLAEKSWIPADVAGRLTAHYRFHREVEHRLQMVADAQTHSLPPGDEGFDRLARFMGECDTSKLQAEILERLSDVHALCEGFFAPTQSAAPADAPDWARDVTDRWASYPALRSQRARELFARLRPELLQRMQETGRPQEALRAFDGFLKGLPAGVQLFALFASNAPLIDMIVDIAATAPELALYLSRNSQVLDAVIGGDFFAPWPGAEKLAGELAIALGDAGDYERQLDQARRWKKEWHFRVGVHLLRGLIGADEAAAQYADLAQAVLSAVWPCVVAEFARKHGPPPGQGAVVLGMGSLGAARIGPRSDLDLIVLYDAAGIEASEGRKPLATRTYYARLTQALITALTAPMAEGKLYEVDMRLRPSGNQGPVATSWQAYQSYQRDEAWTWEHLALTRARAVAGARGLAAEFEKFRRALIPQKADRPTVAQAVLDMRRRLAEAKPPRGVWEAKLGPGRGQDIELVAQAASLSGASAATRTVPQILAGQKSGWFTRDQAAALRIAYELFRRIEVAGKLLTDEPLEPAKLSSRGAEFLLRAVGERDVAALNRQVEIRRAEAAKVIDSAIENALEGG